MQIDAAVKSMHLVVETHHGLQMASRVALAPGVNRIVVGKCVFPENPTWGQSRRAGIDPAFYLGQAPAHPNEAMMSIQALQPTAAALNGIAEFTVAQRGGRG